MTKKEAGEMVGSKLSPGHQRMWERRQEVAPLPLSLSLSPPPKACNIGTWSNAKSWLRDTLLHYG
eukprot:scaffold27078_cov77-Skeletonema_dohrnii-CCMP3373.AAC.4